MEIKKIKIEEIIPYENNVKEHPREQIEQIKRSIQEFGNNDPIAVDENNIIIEGHGRLIALQELGYKEVEVIILKGLTEDQKNAYRIVHNQLTMNSGFDEEMLKEELKKIAFDMTEFGLNEEDLEEIVERYDEGQSGSLEEKFIFPPFSVLDGRSGKWQDRKRQWLEMGIDSGDGRSEELIGEGFQILAEKIGSKTLTGTSVFDPVICELVIKWFNTYHGSIFDPFAGGSVRGIIAKILGCDYTGIDLRQEQIDANYKQAEKLGLKDIKWICDDSLNTNLYLEDNSVDMIFSCPPYADLEVYSDDPRDLSNMDYEDFMKVYREIIRISLNKLKEDRFAVFVVGDVRDEKGFYYDFISDTKKAFIDNGVLLYNEIIKLDALATAPIRAQMQFKNRKCVKVHQNILVFYKGDPKNIRSHYGEIEVGDFTDYQHEE